MFPSRGSAISIGWTTQIAHFTPLTGKAQGDCRRRSRAPYHNSIRRRAANPVADGWLNCVALLRQPNSSPFGTHGQPSILQHNLGTEQSCWATPDFALRAHGTHVPNILDWSAGARLYPLAYLAASYLRSNGKRQV